MTFLSAPGEETTTRPKRLLIWLIVGSLWLMTGAPSVAEEPTGRSPHPEAADSTTRQPIQVAHESGSHDAGRSGQLEPRYQPREPEEKGWYNNSYLFGMTRGVADSTIAPAGKVPLFLLTVPLDVALLPFAFIGGLFG